MRDPFDELKNLTGEPGPTTKSPSPVPATPTSTPEDGTELPGGWVTQIPGDFPLDHGLPQPGGDNGGGESTEDLVTSWTFQPCRGSAYPSDEARTDFRGVAQPGPASRHVRQLALYPDAATAARLLDEFEDELGRCPNHQSGDGGEDIWRKYGTDYDAGDDGFAIVSHYEQDEMLTTSASHFVAVRVGNAVLVSTYDGEFGAARPELVEETDHQARKDVSATVDAMCVFAEGGCTAPAPTGEESPESSEAGDPSLLTLDQLEDLTFELATDWRQIPDREDPTLDCQADWLSSL
ncbi:MAG: hypothetical protein ACRDPJ_18890, partial [Nocardioidaceae bacterium]